MPRVIGTRSIINASLYPCISAVAAGPYTHTAADAEVRDSLRRSLRDPRLSIDGPLPGTEPTPELRVLVVRQAVYVNVTNPQEDFGRPDSPNPACGAPCEFQPATYAPPPAAAGGDSSTAAAALAGGGGGEGGAVVGRLWWGMVSAGVCIIVYIAREGSSWRYRQQQ